MADNFMDDISGKLYRYTPTNHSSSTRIVSRH